MQDCQTRGQRRSLDNGEIIVNGNFKNDSQSLSLIFKDSNIPVFCPLSELRFLNLSYLSTYLSFSVPKIEARYSAIFAFNACAEVKSSALRYT